MNNIVGGILDVGLSIRPKIICMFSGGLDSMGALWVLLTENKYKVFDIHVHHINIQNIENRTKAEFNAVKNITNELTNLGHKFTYSSNTLEFNFMNFIGFPMDMDLCAFTAAQICRYRPEVKHIAMGRTSTDVASGTQDFHNRMERAQNIFKAAQDFPVNPPTYIFPAVNYSKKQLWELLPENIRNNTWSCRIPQYIDGKAVECGQCITCVDKQKIFA